MLSSLFQPSVHSAVYHPVRVSYSIGGTVFDALLLVETKAPFFMFYMRSTTIELPGWKKTKRF